MNIFSRFTTVAEFTRNDGTRCAIQVEKAGLRNRNETEVIFGKIDKSQEYTTGS